jgi:protein-tyrosine phosphatase
MYHAQNENLLNPLNITAIVNAAPSMAPNKFEDETNFTYLTVPIADSSETNIKAYFNLTNKFIDKYIKERGVLVHCAAGISRSATIIIAYVMYNLKMKSEDAFRFVNERHPIAYPNFGFCLQLIEYEKELAL